MMPILLSLVGALGLGLVPPTTPTPGPIGSHSWRVNEVFSNPAGNIQFVELLECCGGAGEINLGAKNVTSMGTGNFFTFPANLTSSSANKHILLATADFAALPGAPTPDHILPPGFFDPSGDTLQWHVYAPSILTISPGQYVFDGTSSLSQTGVVALNSPTNFAGASGSVSYLVVGVPAVPVWAALALGGMLLAGASLLLARRPAAVPV